MIKNEALDMIINGLLNRNLSEAITATENFLAAHPDRVNEDRLFAIKSDYQLMADYWRRGFKDPQMASLYDSLLRRVYVLYVTIGESYTYRHTSYLGDLYYAVNPTSQGWSPQAIRERLEAFVSDIALSGLEQRPTEEIYDRHQEEMSQLFNYILTSGIWSDDFAQAMEDIVLSPTIDTNDQQVIMSSVMLATMNNFDMAKFRMMVHVYQKAADEHVRQRAFVGWVLSVNLEIGLRIYPEEVELVHKMVEDENCCRELVELQKQLIFCIDAERDNDTIQKEIIPDLLNQQGIRINRNGVIEEIEHDELEDILHPNIEEEKLERMEQSVNRMMKMQKEGSDVYYSGFSQMKRFYFFTQPVNWFVPFFPDHPDIRSVVVYYNNSRFLRSTLGNGTFCDSDKYSFLLAFGQMLGRLPQSYRDALTQGDMPFSDVVFENLNHPTYIRRMYLQNLYRFFRLFSHREAFVNIFDVETKNYMVLASPIYSSTHVETSFNEVTAFLVKRNHLDEAREMVCNYGENRKDFQYYMLSAYVGIDVRKSYEQAVALQPDNERALAGFARALFNDGEYQQALDLYDRLLALKPDKKSMMLNRAVCLTNLQRYEEAEKVLFRLNYESPDDKNVNRVLAWTLTNDGKYEQAEKMYRQLLADEKYSKDDLLNCGYCLWFAGQIDDAADCFHRYLKDTGEPKMSIIENELELIRAKGITEPEIQMMLYIL